MSIQLIARELYRLEQEVSALEKNLELCREVEREELEDRLRTVRADRDRMKAVLEGSKGEPSCRRPR